MENVVEVNTRANKHDSSQLVKAAWAGGFFGAVVWGLLLFFPHAVQLPSSRTIHTHWPVAISVVIPFAIVIGAIVLLVIQGLFKLMVREDQDLEVGFILLGLLLVGGLGYFGLYYWQLQAHNHSSFLHMTSKTDVIYFVIGTFTTAGTGQIAADTDAARAMVTVQMIFDFGLISVLVAVALAAISRAGRAP